MACHPCASEVPLLEEDSNSGYTPPLLPASPFWSLMCCSRDRNALPRSAKEAVGSLQQRALIPFDSENSGHENLLRHYFHGCTGEDPPPSRKDPKWKELGFQAEDPRTDFRGGGLLALECMDFMAQNHQQMVQKMLQESQQKGCEYPFSAMIINACFELSAWLHVDTRRPGKGCSGQAYSFFAELLMEERCAFEALTGCMATQLHLEWKKGGRTLLEMGECLSSAKEHVASFLEQHCTTEAALNKIRSLQL